MNIAWAVPRNERPNPFKARGRSLLLIGTAGLGILTTTALSALGSSAAGVRRPDRRRDFKLLVTIAAVVHQRGHLPARLPGGDAPAT